MAIYSLEFPGLSSNIFTFDHLFNHHSDVFNNLAISLTKWPEYRENRCLSCSTNSVYLRFRKRVEKTKKRQNYENRKPTQWAGKKLAYVHIWGKNEKI